METEVPVTLSVLLILAAVCPLSISAQNIFPNTMSLDSLAGSPRASLDDIAWIQGHWQGEAMGGIMEEIWSSPLGGSMMGAFRLIVDDEVRFYEFVTISEEDNSLMLRLKHFHSDLKGWEEKDETVDFPLVKITENKVYFDGFTIEKVSDNEMNVYVIIGSKDNRQEAKFRYKRKGGKRSDL